MNFVYRPTLFGDNLKYLRRLKGLTQQELAEKLNLSRNKIASYESGIVEPNINTFCEICKFFNIYPRSILEENLPEIPPRKFTDINSMDDTILEFFYTYLQQLISQTNKITKIHEGYKEFYRYRKKKFAEDQNKMHFVLEDAMDIMEETLKTNWKFIHEISEANSMEFLLQSHSQE